MGHAGKGVVDDRLIAAVDCVHGGAQLYGGIVNPVPLLVVALARLRAGEE